MNGVCLLLCMIFCHIVDDYYLQGWLAQAKQKSYWNECHCMYCYDYIWALIMHSFSWSFMVMLPIMIMYEFTVSGLFVALFIVNMVVHGFTDDLKANKMKINLWQDQLIHMLQIIITFAVLG